MSRHGKLRIGAVANEVGLGAAMFITLVPIAWLYLSSLQKDIDIINPGRIPSPTLTNYRQMLSADSDFMQLLSNSTKVVLFTTLLCVSIALFAAYSLSKFRWPRAVTLVIFALVAFIQLVPPIALVPSYYVVLNNLGLFNSLTGLVLVNTTLNMPFAVLLLKVYFDNVPDELREAALVDGCGNLLAFRKVLVPLAAPGIAAVAILVGILTWNEFLMALSLTITPDAQTVTVGIGASLQQFSVNYGIMTGSAAVASIPLIVIALVAQRFIVSGLTAGAVKA